MKKSIVLLTLLIPSLSLADDNVSVISVTPRYVTVYQKVCDSVTDQSPNETGGLIGGVLGGITGHQVGKGSGKTAATIAGVIIGQNIGRNTNKQRCWEEPIQELRGETVGFSYKGKVFYHIFEN